METKKLVYGAKVKKGKILCTPKHN